MEENLHLAEQHLLKDASTNMFDKVTISLLPIRHPVLTKNHMEQENVPIQKALWFVTKLTCMVMLLDHSLRRKKAPYRSPVTKTQTSRVN